ncbi:hypothetical protein WMY93_011471 [Mugilogobius chulae]|uniref:Uncharacterized protein n=1 Tax=Mugilogobius chulae TaxID=88201 RepID=A0AAW0P2U1_9GOBI
MPPKKSSVKAEMENEMQEIRKTLNQMSEELPKVTQQLSTLMGLFDEVKNLRDLIKERDKTITELEKRIDQLEQYTRMEDVIITGLSVKPRSYAKAAAAGRNVSAEADTEDLHSLERQVVTFLEEKDIHVDANNIAACHTLPRRDSNKPAIILRFANRKYKTELLRQGRKLKGTAVFLNEHLTKKTAEIAREARILRRNDKIKATWTRNCKVFIQLKGTSPEQARVIPNTRVMFGHIQ